MIEVLFSQCNAYVFSDVLICMQLSFAIVCLFTLGPAWAPYIGFSNWALRPAALRKELYRRSLYLAQASFERSGAAVAYGEHHGA